MADKSLPQLRVRVVDELTDTQRPRIEVIDRDDNVVGDLGWSVEEGGIIIQSGFPGSASTLTIKLACEHVRVGTIEAPGVNAPKR